jgi:HEPN superfamily AbiU2-like protein
MPTTFDTESAAQAAAAELNTAAERDVQYRAERHGEKWAIARLLKRTYWGWDGYPDQLHSPKRAAPDDFNKEVRDFSAHSAYIRSVYVLATHIWRDSSEAQRKLMESTAPSFFDYMGQVLAEYVVLAACRVTDPAKDGRNENLTLETFVNTFGAGSQTGKQLDELRQQMLAHRKKVQPARHKLIAHADREAIRQGKSLGLASWREWDAFWAALRKFIIILNESALGTPYDIEVAGVPGDAAMVLKSLHQSRYFETLLREGDKAVKAACLTVAERPT